MVSLKEVRTHNSSLKSRAPGLVAVFVGGTSGIGLSTAREFVRNTNSPHLYLIGRNSTEASKIISELQEMNSSSQIDFIKSDVSLLKNVDQACHEIAKKENKINLLFMTNGVLTISGARAETEEGLDRKMALHYYSRMRFIQNLAPLLTAASKDEDPKGNLARAVSVHDARMGRSASLKFDDLSLKKPGNFGLGACAAHTTGMNNYALEHMAQAHPLVSFVHSYPSGVETNILRDVGRGLQLAMKVLAPVIRPFMVDLKESGERHLFAATAPHFAPRDKTMGVNGVARGSDEVVGSGSYNLNWNGDVLPKSQNAAKLRTEGAVDKVWKHTEEVFEKITGPEGKY